MSAAQIHQFNFPTTILFGAGARERLPGILKQAGVKRPLFVTDTGIQDLDFFRELEKLLGGAGLAVATYAHGAGNPVLSHVVDGVEAFNGHHSDAIIAVGGGAPMDVAKAVALMAHHPGHLFDYEDGKPDARPADQEIPFLVAVPTTAGTGSEVGRSAVVSDDETHAKKIIFSPRLLPQFAVVDPELTLNLPAKITAATGMDALTHNVEAFLAKGYHPMCDGIALEGIRLIAGNLATCVHEPDNIDARSQMLMASLMGAVAFQKGLGVTHSLAHALSTVCDLHHGLANAIMIPYAMEFNATAVPERFNRMAAIIDPEHPDTHSPMAFLTWLEELREDIGIPNRLSEVGVTAEHLDDLVRFAFADTCHQLNPVAVDPEDLREIYEGAL